MKNTKAERDVKSVKLVVAEKAKRVENLVAEEDAKLEKHIKREENINYILVKIYAINLYIYFYINLIYNAKSGRKAPTDEELTAEEIIRKRLEIEIEKEKKKGNERREAMKKAEKLAEESAQKNCEEDGGNYDSLMKECVKCNDNQIYNHEIKMCVYDQSKDKTKQKEKEGGKRRKKRKTRRRKKSRKSRRRKGKSRRRRRRKSRKN